MKKNAENSVTILFTLIIMLLYASVVRAAEIDEIKQEDQKARNLSFSLLLKAKPVLEKGKPEDVAKLPDKLKGMNGKLVRIRGSLLIPTEAWQLDKPIDFFAVSQNPYGCFCCSWGPPPTVFNVVLVRVKKGEEMKQPYSPQVLVEGVLRIEPKYEDGELVELYRISEATAVKKGNTVF
ncbi:MAG: DUF3299 domain-containing protein [Candidatus Omnitrophota bacterium]